MHKLDRLFKDIIVNTKVSLNISYIKQIKLKRNNYFWRINNLFKTFVLLNFFPKVGSNDFHVGVPFTSLTSFLSEKINNEVLQGKRF